MGLNLKVISRVDFKYNIEETVSASNLNLPSSH